MNHRYVLPRPLLQPSGTGKGSAATPRSLHLDLVAATPIKLRYVTPRPLLQPSGTGSDSAATPRSLHLDLAAPSLNNLRYVLPRPLLQPSGTGKDSAATPRSLHLDLVAATPIKLRYVTPRPLLQPSGTGSDSAATPRSLHLDLAATTPTKLRSVTPRPLRQPSRTGSDSAALHRWPHTKSRFSFSYPFCWQQNEKRQTRSGSGPTPLFEGACRDFGFARRLRPPVQVTAMGGRRRQRSPRHRNRSSLRCLHRRGTGPCCPLRQPSRTARPGTANTKTHRYRHTDTDTPIQISDDGILRESRSGRHRLIPPLPRSHATTRQIALPPTRLPTPNAA